MIDEVLCEENSETGFGVSPDGEVLAEEKQ